MSNNKITLNGKEYKIKDVTFDDMCELEDLGLSLPTIKSKPLTSFRALVSFYCGISLETATKEIEEHFKNGGNFDLYVDLVERLTQSGFFRLISAEQGTTESEGKSESKT